MADKELDFRSVIQSEREHMDHEAQCWFLVSTDLVGHSSNSLRV